MPTGSFQVAKRALVTLLIGSMGCVVPCALPSMYHMLLNVRDSLHGCLRIEIVPVLGWSTALYVAI